MDQRFCVKYQTTELQGKQNKTKQNQGHLVLHSYGGERHLPLHTHTLICPKEKF